MVVIFYNCYLLNSIEKNVNIWYNTSAKYYGGVILKNKNFIKSMELIVSALKERGYDPYSQIYGYLKENEPTYITSYNGARETIQSFDKNMIQDHLNKMCK